MVQKDSQGVNQMLALYRERGTVDYSKTLAIPREQRIPELAKTPEGRQDVSMALAASLLSAFRNIDKVKMTAEQIVELAENIIDSAYEDQLSIEDVLLFLKDFLMGKMGKINQNIDMPSFFEYFEQYRQKRWETLQGIRDEQHTQAKVSGQDTRRRSESLELGRDEDAKTVLGLMQTMYQKDEPE